MKIVSYNVNGLRQRVAQHGSLLRLLNSLDGDIICFQETKLSRQDLSADLTMAQGYEAFVSCTRTTEKGRTCYSGVATFCRVCSAFSSKEVALPLAAEEGFTGLLGLPGKREESQVKFFLEDLEDVKEEDLLKIDSEGRCIITDHGHFVLFNIYGPRAEDDNKKRLRFKHLFYKILEKRWKTLLHQQRRICIVGDFNIAPYSMDRCDAGPDFEENPFRKWLRSLLTESGGPFFDAFRAKHPERKEAYTCWSQRVGAEEFNYGSRIDHILIAGKCLHQNDDGEQHSFFSCHVKECDIRLQFKRGSDVVSRWKGGRSVKLDGSDHVPVYVLLVDLPDLPDHSTPALAVRYVPEVRGWQQTIVSLLQKRHVHVGIDQDDSTKCNEKITGVTIQGDTVSNHQSELCVSDRAYVQSSPYTPGCQVVSQHLGTRSGSVTPGTRNSIIGKKQRSDRNQPQRTIKFFFQQYKRDSNVQFANSDVDMSCAQVHISERQYGSSDVLETGDLSLMTPSKENRGNTSNELMHPCIDDEVSPEIDQNKEGSIGDRESTHPCFKVVSPEITCSSQSEKSTCALLEWQRIQQRMQTTIPLCKGHGEPCVARLVKKPGPNLGRGFYVCARAKGPSSNPQANCGYFKWTSVRSRRKKI